MRYLKNASTLYWKCLATCTGLLFNKLYCSYDLKLFSPPQFKVIYLLIKCGRSSHLRSAHDNVRKYVGIPDCLTIANSSYKNCFQHVGVPLTELINEYLLSLATNLSIFFLKLHCSYCECTWFNLCIAKFVDERKWCYSYTDLVKK